MRSTNPPLSPLALGERGPFCTGKPASFLELRFHSRDYTAPSDGTIDFEMTDLIVIGGGLAGSEAAWQAAQQGLNVSLYEMRPALSTGAHETDYLAELVCSNSLGSNQPDRASGVLKNELRRLSSMLLECAEAAALPAGSALAVDRDLFARTVTERMQNHPRIKNHPRRSNRHSVYTNYYRFRPADFTCVIAKDRRTQRRRASLFLRCHRADYLL